MGNFGRLSFTVILSRAKDPSVGRYVRFLLGSFARLRMTENRAFPGVRPGSIWPMNIER